MTRYLILGVLLLASPAYGQSPEPGSEEHIHEVLQKALENALHDQIKTLFTTWLKDPTDQPHRASVGVRRAIAAYRHALRIIAENKKTGAIFGPKRAKSPKVTTRKWPVVRFEGHL